MHATLGSSRRILAALVGIVAFLAWRTTVDHRACAQDESEPGIAWEYKQEASTPATDSELLEEETLVDQARMLQANGREGWELASTHTFPLAGGRRGGQGAGGYGVIYVFKRPLR